MVVRRRPLLRTAVIGGGAYLAGKSAAQRSAARSPAGAAQDAPASDQKQSGQPGATAPVPGPRSGQAPADVSVSSQLDELVRMHDRGALSDQEFTAAKARLLG
jgi:Short C-terminal domain